MSTTKTIETKETTQKSIKDFLENPIINSDSCFNFYDWFCKDSSLEKRMLKLIPTVKFLVKYQIINPDTTYVWFKNNCPVDGQLYDDIRFSTIKDNAYLGGICPRSGHNAVNKKTSIWFYNDSKFTTLEFDNLSEFKKEIKKGELKELKHMWIEND